MHLAEDHHKNDTLEHENRRNDQQRDMEHFEDTVLFLVDLPAAFGIADLLGAI